MKWLCTLCVFIGCVSVNEFLFAQQWIKTYSSEFSLGPEVYYVKRTTETGNKQTGELYGVRVGYDYIKRCRFYWGTDVLWANGILNGCHGQEKIRLKSKLTDINFEGRLGYTFQSKYWRCASVTPYLGIGYFLEKNNYCAPSPIPIHCKNHFYYIPIGFLSQIFLIPNFSLGLNLKIRFILEGKQYVSHDPENDSCTQNYDEKLQYRVEIPMTYFLCWNVHSLGISLIPFYEYRHYGHRANFPFDFFDTNFRLYGTTLKLLYLF